MTAWVCPNCDGGFPAPIVYQSAYACPWCHRKLAPHVTNKKTYIDMSMGLEERTDE